MKQLLPLSLLACALAAPASAQMTHEWIARVPVGASLTSGTAGMVVDAAGNSYVTGISGSSGNTKVTTAGFATDGATLWTQTYDGPASGSDQARGIALGPGGSVWVVGNTPGPGSYSQVLLLEYDGATGALLNEVVYATQLFKSEHGAEVVVDAAGSVYVAGGTVGDGGDVLVVKFDAAGQHVWTSTWDGPAPAPYSQDVVKDLQLDPAGDLLLLVHGVMSTLQPDFVVLKYDPADGSLLWESSWGVNGGDYPADMAVDESGDVYATGTGIAVTDQYSTVKFRGSDGKVLWQAYDQAGFDDDAFALALDGAGGVYVTGTVDPDGNVSNFNDDLYTVKRDAATGAFRWAHRLGASCVGCFDGPSDVIVDAAGNVIVAGSTSSPPYSGVTLTLVLDPDTGLETQRGVLTPAPGQGAGSGILRLDAVANIYNGGQTYNVNTGAVEMTVFKYPTLIGPVAYCTAGVSASGCAAAIEASGAPSATAASGFTLSASDVEGGKDGLFFFGANGRQANAWGNGTSYQCVVPPVRRAGLMSGSGTDGQCDGAFAKDLNALWCPSCPKAHANPGAGALVQAQLWYRDPLSTSNRTTSLSDAVEFTVAP